MILLKTHITFIVIFITYLTILIVAVKCKTNNPFNDQQKATKRSNSFQIHHDTSNSKLSSSRALLISSNSSTIHFPSSSMSFVAEHPRNFIFNNPYNKMIISGSKLPRSIDKLDQKLIINSKSSKDDKLKKVSTIKAPSSSSSSLTSALNAAGIVHFPKKEHSKDIFVLQHHQHQQHPRHYHHQTRLIPPKCSINEDEDDETEKLFCTQVQNYPTQNFFKEIEENFSKYENDFGDDLLLPTEIINNSSISRRLDDDDDYDEETLCESRKRLIFPQAGLTKHNTWSFIINHENFTQGILIEECINPGKSCSMTEYFPNGYRTECKQNFIYRKLLMMSEIGIIKKDLFQVPSFCQCILIKLF